MQRLSESSAPGAVAMSTTTTDPDATVHISKYSYKRRLFHVSEDCCRLHNPDLVRPKRRGALPDDWSECRYCGDGEIPKPEQTDTDCPLCGTTVPQLAKHLEGGCS